MLQPVPTAATCVPPYSQIICDIVCCFAAAGASRSNSHATAGPASGKEAAGKQRRAKQRESTSSPGNRKQVDGKSPKKILKQKKKKVRASHEPKAKSRGGWSAD